MSNPNQPVGGVSGPSGVKQVTSGSSDPAADLQAGELVITQNADDSNDVTLDFRGNGVATPTEIMGKFIDRNPLNDPLFDDFKGNSEATQYAAVMALRNNPRNQKLMQQLMQQNRNPATVAIPNGELFSATQSDLKTALTPFKGKLNELRSALANLQPTGGMSSGQSKVLGRTPRGGAGLPIDPNV